MSLRMSNNSKNLTVEMMGKNESLFFQLLDICEMAFNSFHILFIFRVMTTKTRLRKKKFWIGKIRLNTNIFFSLSTELIRLCQLASFLSSLLWHKVQSQPYPFIISRRTKHTLNSIANKLRHSGGEKVRSSIHSMF